MYRMRVASLVVLAVLCSPAATAAQVLQGPARGEVLREFPAALPTWKTFLNHPEEEVLCQSRSAGSRAFRCFLNSGAQCRDFQTNGWFGRRP